MPGSRDMDIFKQQEMHKNRPQVRSKLKDWHDWLVNHVPRTIKDEASRVFKTFKDKVMGLYKGEKNAKTDNELNERETRIKDQTQPYQLRGHRISYEIAFLKPKTDQTYEEKVM